MASQEDEAYFAKLESIGEERVEAMLVNGRPFDVPIPTVLVNEWVLRKKAAKVEQRDKQAILSIEIAQRSAAASEASAKATERAAEAANFSARMAAISALISLAAILVTLAKEWGWFTRFTGAP